MTTSTHDPDDDTRDAHLRAALRHAPDAELAVPPAVRAQILAAARAEAGVRVDAPFAAPDTVAGAASRGRHAATRPTRVGAFARVAEWLAMLARPPVASAFGGLMVAVLGGWMWWGQVPEWERPAAPHPVPPVRSEAPAGREVATANPSAKAEAPPAPPRRSPPQQQPRPDGAARPEAPSGPSPLRQASTPPGTVAAPASTPARKAAATAAPVENETAADRASLAEVSAAPAIEPEAGSSGTAPAPAIAAPATPAAPAPPPAAPPAEPSDDRREREMRIARLRAAESPAQRAAGGLSAAPAQAPAHASAQAPTTADSAAPGHAPDPTHLRDLVTTLRAKPAAWQVQLTAASQPPRTIAPEAAATLLEQLADLGLDTDWPSAAPPASAPRATAPTSTPLEQRFEQRFELRLDMRAQPPHRLGLQGTGLVWRHGNRTWRQPLSLAQARAVQDAFERLAR